MLFIDDREPKEIIEKLKYDHLVSVKVERLPIADYAWGDNILVERKTVPDFFSSVYTGRLWKQLANIKDNSDSPLLIVEGALPTKFSRRTANEVAVFWNSIIAVWLGFKISVLTPSDLDTTAYLIFKAYTKSDKKKKPFERPVKKKSSSIKDIKNDMLCCIGGIGRVKARRLLENYKYNVLEIASANIEDLKRIIGKKPALNLKEIFI